MGITMMIAWAAAFTASGYVMEKNLRK